MLDVHSHLMPGVDDGAVDLAQSRAALAIMREQGIRTLVTTPHFDTSLTLYPERCAVRMERLDAAWRRLRELARTEFPDLRLERGAELMLDTPSPNLDDPRLRLAGTSFVLVEFPGFRLPPQTERVVQKLVRGGRTPILAHPERYPDLADGLDRLEELQACGCRLQVNHGSLVGRYGETARRTAFALLQRGWVHYLASDYHARGRLYLSACREALEEQGGGEQAELLLNENLRRLLADEPPLPVPPLALRRSWWARLRDRFR